MTIKDREARNAYIREWKRKDRRRRGIPLKKDCGNNHKPRTEEQIAQSKRNRKLWEKEWRMTYLEIKPQKRLLWAAKKRAKEKQISFNIVEEDIIIPTHCPILGIPLVNHRPRGSSRRDIASLDRIDPTKGYVKGNVEVISWLANTMKNNATPELLVAFSKEMLRRYDV